MMIISVNGKNFSIYYRYDKEAGVWIASSQDIRGLVLEDASLGVLTEQVNAAAPELLALNRGV